MMPSLYPDGTTRNIHGLVQRVAPPQSKVESTPNPKILLGDITRIASHRITNAENSPIEEYLVKWRVPKDASTTSPLSWHSLDDLRECLPKLQKYINSLVLASPGTSSKGLKRKSPDYVDEERVLHPANPLDTKKVYNGTLYAEHGVIKVKPLRNAGHSDHVPWDAIKIRAAQVGDRLPQAKGRIRAEFLRRIAESNASRPTKGARLSLVNNIDDTSPSLDFKFVEEYRLGKGVEMMDPGTIVGCGNKYPWSSQHCSPHMGQHIGCEYSRVCDCMEYAEVDVQRLKPEEEVWMKLHQNESKLDLPKRFPYYSSGAKESCLVPFYLEKRSPIYECNSNCDCGPDCRNRLVQKGRRFPLEIFKTDNGRGWGLRCKADLRPGDFIDTYRGEVITAEEADVREEQKKSASYLFTLDKFENEDLALDDCYIVDGEYVGGPTRFMNHSCEPNCQQHTVSLNKFDRRVYLLAFFANQYIAKGTELTFDYLDNDGVVDDLDEPQAGKTQPCYCGAKECRKRLWV